MIRIQNALQSQIHSYPLTVLESHLDAFGHMNHASYLVLFEAARWELITQNGYGLEKISETGLGPVVLEANIRFHHELKLREKIVIETQAEVYKKKCVRIFHTIKKNKNECGSAPTSFPPSFLKNELVYCRAILVFGLFDLKRRRLVGSTPEWLRALGLGDAS